MWVLFRVDKQDKPNTECKAMCGLACTDIASRMEVSQHANNKSPQKINNALQIGNKYINLFLKCSCKCL